MPKDFTEHDIDLERIYPKDRVRFGGRSFRIQSIRKTRDSSKPYETELTFVIIYEDK